MNLAKGDFIFVLHSDSVLEPGWSEIVKNILIKTLDTTVNYLLI